MSDYCLFFCWPRLNELIEKCIENWNGNSIIFIGERGGCTADPTDFLLDNGWTRSKTDCKVVSWCGIRDQIIFFTRP